MNRNPVLIMAIVSAILTGCNTPKEAADLIITNAVIYTVDDDFTVAECMVIKEGKIVAVGSQKELQDRYDAAKVIDAAGKFIYPGFYDPHCHFYHYGAGLATRADLSLTHSYEEVLEQMEQFATARSEGWLAGRGWDQNNWPVKEFPDNSELNTLFPDRPVILIRVDGHAVIANDVALKRAGIDHNTRIAGGEILVKNGKPTGILIDNAADILKDMFLKETTQSEEGEEELINGILQGQKNCFAAGITTVGDAGLDYHHIRLLEDLQLQGRLKMNVYAMLNYTPENIAHYITKGPYRTDRMNIRSVKFYADGALGSRGALLLEPYSDRPDYHGILTLDPEKFRQQCKEIFDYGYQVHTHAIGDSANRLVLNIYGEILRNKNDLRWRIEHAQVVHPDDFRLFADYSIIPSVNTIHATSDMGWAVDRLGIKRIKTAYAYQELLKTNGWLCNGSDFPVESINPLLGFYAAVSRQDIAGNPKGGWQTENALTREDALRAMTIWAAKASFEEKEKGALTPGKNADFVILDRDIMSLPLKNIPDTKVLETWIFGERVH